MTTRVLQVESGPGISSKFIAFVLLAIIVFCCFHAVQRHGEQVVESIDNCFNKNGTMAQFHNPATNRKAEICQMDDGKFALQVREGGTDKVVTKFIKEKMKSFDQVAKYLSNSGYRMLQ